MLKSEVAIMRKMNHPNIIHLYDFMESSSNYYLIMQACNNGDMTKYMAKLGKKYWSEEEAIFYLKQIAMGFRELHRHKVMHRDFKLDNLFMNGDMVVIADLGFAKAGREMTQTQCGTPLYMAPEVFAGKKYTNSADLWSVGVSFYQLLFGKFPFDANSTQELQQKIQKESGPNLRIPRHVNPISAQCEELLRSILTADPDRRITWNKFFRHPLFAEKAKPQGRQGLGGALNSMVMASTIKVNNRFNQEQNETLDDNATLHQADKYGDPNAQLQGVNEDTRMNEDQWQLRQKQVQLEDAFRENTQRYWHERNKILFLFTTVRKLRDLNKKLHPQNPVRMSIKFFNTVLAQKALIYLQTNVRSVTEPNYNPFKMPEHENWLKSSQSYEIRSRLQQDEES
jgi:serine/threonine protein kinase